MAGLTPPCERENGLGGVSNAHVVGCDSGADCGAADCWVRVNARGQVRYNPVLAQNSGEQRGGGKMTNRKNSIPFTPARH